MKQTTTANKRPDFKPGQKLTLIMQYWQGDGKRVARFVSCREDRKCVTGFRCTVRVSGMTRNVRLDASWFKEYRA